MEPDRASAFFWTLFSGGGFVVALLLPIHIVLLHFGPALGLLEENPMDQDAMVAWLNDIFVKVYLVLLIGGSLFHGAHRFKYVLFDWGMTGEYKQVGYVLYAMAAAGTAGIVYATFVRPLLNL